MVIYVVYLTISVLVFVMNAAVAYCRSVTLFQQMLHSYKYAEVNWEHLGEKSTLEIQVVRPPRNSARLVTRIRTRQAGVIDHLMRQLQQLNATNDRSLYI